MNKRVAVFPAWFEEMLIKCSIFNEESDSCSIIHYEPNSCGRSRRSVNGILSRAILFLSMHLMYICLCISLAIPSLRLSFLPCLFPWFSLSPVHSPVSILNPSVPFSCQIPSPILYFHTPLQSKSKFSNLNMSKILTIRLFVLTHFRNWFRSVGGSDDSKGGDDDQKWATPRRVFCAAPEPTGARSYITSRFTRKYAEM